MEFNFLYAYLFVIIAMLYSYKKGFGLEKEILSASIRGYLQLFLLSFVLVYIFESQKQIYIFLSAIVMLFFAAFTASSRVKLPKYSFLIPFVSILIPTAIILLSLLLVGAIELKANVAIPLAGMVIGNALNVYTISVERLKSDLKESIPLIEGILSLGVPLHIATNENVKKSIKSSLHPILNNLQTLGIVFIPGMMSGMLIAGADPLYALSFQMTIMYMLLGVSLGCSIVACKISYRYLVLH